MRERNRLHFRQSRNTPTSTTTARTAVTTGHTRAVIDRAPETPSSAKLTRGLAPPPVVTVETGRTGRRRESERREIARGPVHGMTLSTSGRLQPCADLALAAGLDLPDAR